jgi:hypothetical protein
MKAESEEGRLVDHDQQAQWIPWTYKRTQGGRKIHSQIGSSPEGDSLLCRAQVPTFDSPAFQWWCLVKSSGLADTLAESRREVVGLSLAGGGFLIRQAPAMRRRNRHVPLWYSQYDKYYRYSLLLCPKNRLNVIFQSDFHRRYPRVRLPRLTPPRCRENETRKSRK